MNRFKNLVLHKGILSFLLAVLMATMLITSFSSPVFAAPASELGHIEASIDLERINSLDDDSVLIGNDNSWDRLAVNSGALAMVNDYKDGEPNTDYDLNQQWRIVALGSSDLYTIQSLLSPSLYLNYDMSLSTTPGIWEIKRQTINLNATTTAEGYLIRNPFSGEYLYQQPISSEDEFLPAPTTLSANPPNSRSLLWNLYGIVVTSEKDTKLSIYDEADDEVTGETLSLPISSLSAKIFVADEDGEATEETVAENYSFSVVSGDEFLSVDLFTGKVVGKAAGTATIMAASASGAKSYIEVVVTEDDLPEGVTVEKTAVRHPDDPYYYDVTIEITADEIIAATPDTDVVLVMDTSGSMGDNNKIANAKAAAEAFCNTMLSDELAGKVRVGLVTFAGAAQLATRSPLVDSTQRDTLISTIRGLSPPTGGTNIQAGIKRAQEILEASDKPEANKVIVLLGDGNPTFSYTATGYKQISNMGFDPGSHFSTFFAGNRWPNYSTSTTPAPSNNTTILTQFSTTEKGDGANDTFSNYDVGSPVIRVNNNGLPTISQAYLAAEQGIKTYTIGFGIGANSFAERILKDVAGVGDGFYRLVNASSGSAIEELKEAFGAIANAILSPIRDGMLYDEFLVTAPILDNTTITSHGNTNGTEGPFGTFNAENGAITWTLGDVNFKNGTVTLTYTVWLNPYASRVDPYSDSAQLNSNTVYLQYKDLNDQPRQIDILPPNGEIKKTSLLNFWKVDAADPELYLNTARFVIRDHYDNFLKFDKLNNAKAPQQYAPVDAVNFPATTTPVDFMTQHPYSSEPEYYLDTAYDGFSLVDMPVGIYRFYEVVTPGTYEPPEIEDPLFTMAVDIPTQEELDDPDPEGYRIVDGYKVTITGDNALLDPDDEVLIKNEKSDVGTLTITKELVNGDDLIKALAEFKLNLTVYHNNAEVLNEDFFLKHSESKLFDIPLGSTYTITEPGLDETPYTLDTGYLLPRGKIFDPEGEPEVVKNRLQIDEETPYYTVVYYKDSINGAVSPTNPNYLGHEIVVDAVEVGDQITLSNAAAPSLDAFRPDGYGAGAQQGTIPFVITADSESNIIKVLYVAPKASYTVEYYKDTLGNSGDSSYLGFFTVNGAIVGEEITLDNTTDPMLNRLKPAGYEDGVQQGDVPFVLTAESGSNVIKVLYLAQKTSYTIEYYKDSAGTPSDPNFLGNFAVNDVAVGTPITLNSVLLNRNKPAAGYGDGVQQAPVPFIITVDSTKNIIKVVYQQLPAPKVSYTVEYYKDTVGTSSDPSYLGFFTVNGATAGEGITLTSTTTPALNRLRPAGYGNGVQQGTIPFVLTADSNSNIIKVLYVDEIPGEKVSYTVEYYKDTVGTPSDSSYLGYFSVDSATVGEAITLSSTTTPALNRFKPTGYGDGVQQGTIPFVLTADSNSNVIKVLYRESPATKVSYTVEYYKDAVGSAGDANYLGSVAVDDATVGEAISLSGTTNPSLNQFKPTGYGDGVQQGTVPFVITVDSDSNIIKVLYVKPTVTNPPATDPPATDPPATDPPADPYGKKGDSTTVPITSGDLGAFFLIICVIGMAAVALFTQKFNKRQNRTK